MNKEPFRRLMSLIPPKPPSPNTSKLFDFDQHNYQPKLQLKSFQLDELPMMLNRQHLQIMSLVPQRLKTQVYRKCKESIHRKAISEDERFHTIEVDQNKSRHPTEIRKISCTNSYQNQQQQNQLRKLKYSYEVRRKQSSLNNFAFEQNFMNFSQLNSVPNINKVRIEKQCISQRLIQRYDRQIANKLVRFFEIPQNLDFTFWKSIVQKIFQLNQEQIMVIVFRLLHNHRHISSTELFNLQLTLPGDAIQKDCQAILKYIQMSLNTEIVDSDEIEYLNKSSIFKESLTISNLLSWTEVYQIDVFMNVEKLQTISEKKQKGLNYRRQVPIDQFISIYLSEGKDETVKYKSIQTHYPTHFTENEPFSITFPIFRKIFSRKTINLWNDIKLFFCGLIN